MALHRGSWLSMAEGEVKVTIKTPSSASGSSPEEKDSSPKVSVRVRPPSGKQRKEEPQTAASDFTTSVTVKKPEPKLVEPEPQKSYAEELLFNATQNANCTQLLEALQSGINPNIRDPNYRTPLHFMAGIGLAPACVLLIHFGAQLDAQDKDGLTPLHMAAGYANARTLRVLVAAGADTELTGTGQGTPLEVVKGLGEYQYSQVYGKKKRTNKKDEKLEKLKQCVDILLNTEEVRADNKWEDLLEETLRVIAI
ncbi:MAG: hypothetical protein SGPRY_005516 [Prymnesium sp.]